MQDTFARARTRPKGLTKKTSNTDRAAFNFFAYIVQSVGTHYSGCQLFRSVCPMQPLGQARVRDDRVYCIQVFRPSAYASKVILHKSNIPWLSLEPKVHDGAARPSARTTNWVSCIQRVIIHLGFYGFAGLMINHSILEYHMTKFITFSLYARYLCSRNALGRPSAARDDRVSCIQVTWPYIEAGC